MKKSNLLIKKTIFFALILSAVIFNSCKNNFMQESEKLETAAVSFELCSERTVFSDPLIDNLSFFELSITNSNSEVVYTASCKSYLEFSRLSVILEPEEEYTFDLSAKYNSTIFAGSTKQIVVRGNNTITIYLLQSETTSEAKLLGYADIRIFWPEEKDVEEVKIIYSPVNDETNKTTNIYTGIKIYSGTESNAGKKYFILEDLNHYREGTYNFEVYLYTADEQTVYRDVIYFLEYQKTQYDFYVTDFEPSFRIYYETNGGTLDRKEDRYSISSGYILPDENSIEKLEYKFEGWYSDSECTVAVEDGKPGKVSGNKTVYAKWIPALYFKKDKFHDYFGYYFYAKLASYDARKNGFDKVLYPGTKLKITLTGIPVSNESAIDLYVRNSFAGGDYFKAECSYSNVVIGELSTWEFTATIPDSIQVINYLCYQFTLEKYDTLSDFVIYNPEINTEIIEYTDTPQIDSMSTDCMELEKDEKGIKITIKTSNWDYYHLIEESSGIEIDLKANENLDYHYKTYVFYYTLTEENKNYVFHLNYHINNRHEYMEDEYAVCTAGGGQGLPFTIPENINDSIITINGNTRTIKWSSDVVEMFNGLGTDCNYIAAETEVYIDKMENFNRVLDRSLLVPYYLNIPEGSSSIEFKTKNSDWPVNFTEEHPAIFNELLSGSVSLDSIFDETSLPKNTFINVIGYLNFCDNQGYAYKIKLAELNDVKITADKVTPIPKYNIDFNTGCDLYIDPVMVKESFNNTYGVTFPVKLSREGYEFAGWYLESYFMTPVTPDTVFTQDKTLYAKWERKYCTITFVTDCDYVYDPVQIERNSTYILPGYGENENVPEREGYEFAGWYLESFFMTPVTPDTVFTQDKTLYAKWEEKPCTITFVTDCDCVYDPVQVKRNSTYILPGYGENENLPEKEGYVFMGWNVNETICSYFKVTEDTTVTAVWKEGTSIFNSLVTLEENAELFEYTFQANENDVVFLYWADAYEGHSFYDSNKKTDVKVSLSNSTINQKDSGFNSPSSYIVSETGSYTVTVEPYNYSDYGDFYLWVIICQLIDSDKDVSIAMAKDISVTMEENAVSVTLIAEANYYSYEWRIYYDEKNYIPIGSGISLEISYSDYAAGVIPVTLVVKARNNENSSSSQEYMNTYYVVIPKVNE